ncbi:MAG: response regulator [Flavobacteriales bacterium]|nr:response regulator [Flavobacteriales bacterium]
MEKQKDIWFVDDDDIFRFIVKGMMDKTDYAERADYFDDGDRAILRLIDISKRGKPEPKILFLDLSMKHLEGWQMLDLMNEFGTKTKVVVLTSSVGLKDRIRAEKEPLVMGYLTKPIDRRQIVKYIEELAA